MASVTALVQFTQGVTGNPGEVLVGSVAGGLVTIANVNNLNVNSWQIDLAYKPPGSALVVGTLAFNDASSIPAASFTPDVPGSYRIVLKVWAVVNRTGNNFDVDIRNFVIPLTTNGLVIPPYQKDPDRLPTLASGSPGAKPNEMNINGTELGWEGDGTDGLLAEAIANIGTGGAGVGVNFRDILRMEHTWDNFHTPISMVFDGTSLWSLKSNLGAGTGGGIGLFNYGVVRINPATGLIIESVDAGTDPETNIATCLVWTGARLFMFGFDLTITTDAWVQEVLPGSPTTFGPKNTILSGGPLEGILSSATYTVSNKIWIGTQAGSVYRYDVLSGLVDLNPIVADGQPILSMAFDPDGSHYGDATPRLFISRQTGTTIERWTNVASVSPSTDDSFLGGFLMVGLTVANGFLWVSLNSVGFQPTILKLALNPMGVVASTNSLIDDGYCYDFVYDPVTTKLWGVFTDGYGCGGPPQWYVERYNTTVLAPEIVYLVNTQGIEQPVVLGSIRPFGGIFGGNLWLCDPQLNTLDRGTFYKVSTTTGIPTEVNPSVLISEPLAGRVQYMTNNADFWDGVSDIIVYIGTVPGFVRISESVLPPVVGFQLTVFDGTGAASPGSEVGVYGNLQSTINNYNLISSPFGSIRATHIKDGVWYIGKTQNNDVTLFAAMTNGNSTGPTPWIPGSDLVISQGNSITSPFGQNPTDSGVTLNLQAGSSNVGATGDGGAVTINAGSAISTNGNGGNIVLTPGAPTGTGIPGVVHVVGKLTVDGLIDPTGLVLDQQASAPFFAATKGTLWVKNTGPTTLYFTDSAGTDFAVVGGGGSTLAAVLASGNTTGATAYVTGTDIILSSGDKLKTADGLNPGDSGVNLNITAGAGNLIGNGGVVTIRGGTGGPSNGAAGVAEIAGGDASGTAQGGGGIVSGGTAFGTGVGGLARVVGGGALGAAGGTADVIGGNAAGVGFKGGLARLIGGQNTAASGDGGDAEVRGGSPLTSGDGGVVTITGGDGMGTNHSGGGITIQGGITTGTAVASSISILAGNSGTGATGNGAAVSVTAGNALSTNGNGGDITLTPGSKTGSGTDGVVHVVGKLTVDGLIDPTGLVLDQQGTTPFSGAGVGTLWVKNTTPTTLYFTDSAGTDFNVGTGGGGGTLASVLASGNTTGTDAWTTGTDIILSSGDKLKSGDGQNPTDAGISLNIVAGQGNTTGDGGAITVTGGAGGPTAGAGGAVSITGGAITTGTQFGGAVNIAGGFGGYGGDINLTSGSATGSAGFGGGINITGGNGSGTGGTLGITILGGVPGVSGLAADISITGSPGGTTSGDAGNIVIRGGLPVDGNGGTITLTGRNGVGTDRSGGDVLVTAGNATGTATGAVINLTSGDGGATGNGANITLQAGRSKSGTGGTGGFLGLGGSNSSGNDGGNASFTGGTGVVAGSGGSATVQGGTGGPSSGTGGTVFITGGNGGTAGNGGAVSVSGGAPANGNGGAITLTSGNGVGTNRNSGGITISCGASTGTGTAGNLSLTAGAGGTTGTAGTVSITAGAGGTTSGNGGAVTISGGNATTGTGGALTIRGGGVLTTGNGGAVTIQGRNGAGGTSSGGDVSISSGNSVSSGIPGIINIQAGSGGSTAAGGQISISGGDGGSTSGDGGQVTVQGGTATDGAGGAVIVSGRNGVGTNRAGGNLTLTGGNAIGSGAGGIIFITAGNGGSTGTAGNIFLTGGLASVGGTGGNISVAGGNGNGAGTGGAPTVQGGQGGATGVGGAVSITGGSGGATSGAGGAVTVQGGTPTDGNGGGLTLSARNGVGTNRSGGTVSVTAGNATGTGTSGSISVTAGNGGVTSGNGAAITLTGGNAGAGSGGNGGNIVLAPGTGDGGGTAGSINASSAKITSLADPTLDQDALNQRILVGVNGAAQRGTVQTTNATPTTIITYSGLNADGFAVTLFAQTTGLRDNNVEAAGYYFTGTFRRSGGTITQVGSTLMISQNEDTAGWDATMTVSGTTILIQVTGAAASTINWQAVLRAVRNA